jgi:hypothetical protein
VKSENRKNKIFFFGLFFLIFTSVGITYYRYIIALDYFVLLQTSCDPAVESCFLYECDPTAEDAECSENPADDAYYYKQIEKKAYALQSCVQDLEGCSEATCQEGEENCTEIQCDISLEESGGVCYGPGLIVEEEDKSVGEEEKSDEEGGISVEISGEGVGGDDINEDMSVTNIIKMEDEAVGDMEIGTVME